jgi:hypothetical protein
MRLEILLIIHLVGLGFLVPALTQITFAISMLDTESTTGAQPGNITGMDQITLKAQMKPDEFLADNGYYQVKKFGFVASNNSEICPSNNCKYTVENGQLRSNKVTGGYVFRGQIKVTTEESDVKKSKFYDFRVNLDKTGEEERNGETLQSLGGTFGLGQDITYDITNATLKVDDKNPIITIQAERSPF